MKLKAEEPQLQSVYNSQTLRDVYLPFPAVYDTERSQAYRSVPLGFRIVAE